MEVDIRYAASFGLVALAILVVSTAASAAVSATLVVDGVQGAGPGGSITVTSFQFLPPDGKQVRVTKLQDTTSPQLQQLVAMGTSVATVVMTVTWPAKAGTVTYAMSDVVFSSMITDSGVDTLTFGWTSIAQTPTRGAATVAGQVFDLCSGKPVPNASVTLSSPSNGNAVTDGKGRFKLTGIADGRYDLDVSTSGYLDLTKPVVIAGAKSHGPVIVGLTPLVPSGGCD